MVFVVVVVVVVAVAVAVAVVGAVAVLFAALLVRAMEECFLIPRPG